MNIAGFCARKGKKVLVVDCDPQANATAGLGISLSGSDRNMYDVFMSRIEDFPETKIIDIIKRTDSGIDLAPSHLDLVGIDPYLYRAENRAGILKEALGRIRDSYDLILVDTPPSMGQLFINGLFAADRIVVTLDSGTFALDGVTTMSTIFGDIRDDLGKDIRPDMAIVTRWGEGNQTVREVSEPARQQDLLSLIRNIFYKKPEPTAAELEAEKERTAEHERLEKVLAEIRQRFPLVFTVPFSPVVYEAQKRGLPLSHFAPDSSAGHAYETITDEVMRWI
ncbi:ParA family protein [uncultured Methanoregula sp.]|uniref:ParA family protein n=1 Tax=uncultured Methanoregula sp. TaxID=1005933 RepID=UPI003748C55D